MFIRSIKYVCLISVVMMGISSLLIAGLDEEEAIEKFQKEQYPNLKKEIDKAAGFEVTVEVKWDKLAVDGYSHMYNEAFTKVYFKSLIDALQAVCNDEIGKKAVQEGLKKVIITNEKGGYGASGFTFENGILTLDHHPFTNIDDIAERSNGIQKLLNTLGKGGKGLLELKAIQKFQKEQYPALKKEIDNALGFEVEIEVKWDKLAVDGQSHLYNEGFTKVYFKSLIEAFKGLCINEKRKQWVQERLKKIIITNEKGNCYPSGITAENGILTIDHDPVTNIDDVKDRADQIQRLVKEMKK